MKAVLLHFFEDRIRFISGSLGIRIRRWYYKQRLKYVGSNVIIDTGVYISGASSVSLHDHIWIDKNVILIAGQLKNRRITKKLLDSPQAREGELIINSYAHIGINTIIQAHGGVFIDRYFTSSAGVKIYSFSNDPRACNKGTLNIDNNNPGYIVSPVVIEENVWLGLNVTVVGAKIGSNTFVKPNSVVIGHFEGNKILKGNPAKPNQVRFSPI